MKWKRKEKSCWIRSSLSPDRFNFVFEMMNPLLNTQQGIFSCGLVRGSRFRVRDSGFRVRGLWFMDCKSLNMVLQHSPPLEEGTEGWWSFRSYIGYLKSHIKDFTEILAEFRSVHRCVTQSLFCACILAYCHTPQRFLGLFFTAEDAKVIRLQNEFLRESL